MTKSDIISAIATAAARWIDVDYPPRIQAMGGSLEASNRFTSEALHFAINQQMNELSVENLNRWADRISNCEQQTVAVLNPGNIPLAGLQDLLAIIIAGHEYQGCLSSKSPYLLPAFAYDLIQESQEIPIEFVDREDLFAGASKLVATGNSQAIDWAISNGDAAGISPDNMLLRGPGIGIAILDGNETDDDYDRLAEDILLHEGLGCRSVAIIWAPESVTPDRLLNSMAQFRGVFPGHPDTGGALEIQRAFLAALNASHAYSDDKSFLISKGDPEVQSPGHVRWVSYYEPTTIQAWIRDNNDVIQVVVSRMPDKWDSSGKSMPFGYAQRPPLGWDQSGKDIFDFLDR